MKLNIQSAVEAKIVRKPAAEKEPVRIFDRYVEQTLAKLDRSISDARGRYEEGKQYAVAKPSLNWKVVNKVDDLSKEQVRVWLKVGIEKVAIDGDATEVKIPSSMLLTVLEEMRSSIEAIAASPSSAEGQAFHELAIKQAKPKTAPVADGATEWRYDANLDRYLAV
jgi:hypothetical protein